MGHPGQPGRGRSISEYVCKASYQEQLLNTASSRALTFLLGFFAKSSFSIGMSDPDYQVGLVKQDQSNSPFLYSSAFQNFSSYCRMIGDSHRAPWNFRDAKPIQEGGRWSVFGDDMRHSNNARDGANHDSSVVQAPQEQNDWGMNHLLTSKSVPTKSHPHCLGLITSNILNNSVVCVLLVQY